MPLLSSTEKSAATLPDLETPFLALILCSLKVKYLLRIMLSGLPQVQLQYPIQINTREGNLFDIYFRCYDAGSSCFSRQGRQSLREFD